MTSPADDYDEWFAAERIIASGLVRSLAIRSLVSHAGIAAVGLLFVPVAALLRAMGALQPSHVAAIFFVPLFTVAIVLLWIVSFVAAVQSAIATAEDWRVLPWTHRALGLAPWTLFATEAAFLLVLMTTP